MKPAAFDYIAVESLDQALALKARHGEDARWLAGGQSLLPAMNFRLAQPAILLDINLLSELDFISESNHDATLRNIDHYFGQVVSGEEVIACWPATASAPSLRVAP